MQKPKLTKNENLCFLLNQTKHYMNIITTIIYYSNKPNQPIKRNLILF